MTYLRFLIVGYCTVGVVPNAPGQVPAIPRWCAEPRHEEPLLRDARGLVSADDSAWATRRAVFDIPLVANAQIAVIHDEATCRRAAGSYRDHMRQVADETWPEKPVLLVRVGDMYLVDDLRSRAGEDPVWTVLLLDKNWNIRYTFGRGS